jgi:hypothetical protein
MVVAGRPGVLGCRVALVLREPDQGSAARRAGLRFGAGLVPGPDRASSNALVRRSALDRRRSVVGHPGIAALERKSVAPAPRTRPRRDVHVDHDLRPRTLQATDRPRKRLPRRAEAARQIGAALAAHIASFQSDDVALDLHTRSSAAARLTVRRRLVRRPTKSAF